MAYIKRDHTNAAVLFLDIDDFKIINDTLGHNVGDRVLQKFALNISSMIREEDVFARIGGDEFVVILVDLDDDKMKNIEFSEKFSKKLHKKASEYLYINGHNLQITISIGVNIIDQTKQDINEIMKNADVAMYKAKQSGKNQTSVFQTYMGDEIENRMNLYNEIKHALENNELELYYQPITEINTDKIISCEALIRWNHPMKGVVVPDLFIPFSEDNELIIKIGRFVIQQAVEDYKVLSKYVDTIAINISSTHFMMENFVDDLHSFFVSQNVKPSGFKIEITESLFIGNLDIVRARMQILKEYGFAFSMDDFGTGYSSLSYLKHLNFDFLKIDKSFITDFLENEEDASLVKMIISIAKQLNMKIIAEGVETKEQFEFLKALQCDYYQGYLKSKPLTRNEFQKLVIANNK